MEVKPQSHRHVPQLPDDPPHTHFMSITRFSASELLLSHLGGFSGSDRACKPRQLITRLCPTPSLVSASLHTRVSFVSQIASELPCYCRQLSQVLNTADDFLCVLITQNHNVHLDFMTSFSDMESCSAQGRSEKESGSCCW